jgi:hypothetical protein
MTAHRAEQETQQGAGLRQSNVCVGEKAGPKSGGRKRKQDET